MIDAVGRADHDDRPQLGQVSRSPDRAHTSATRAARLAWVTTTRAPRVGEDVAQELALVRRVDRHLDRAELQRGEEADDLLGRVLEQGRHPVARGPTPRPGEAVRGAVRGPVHLAGR